MRKTYIGELEEVILLVVALLQEEAYGVAITKEINDQLKRNISVSAVHATLHRLESKGYVESFMGGATTTRGGRRKRFFKVTQLGSQILTDIQASRSLLWGKLPPNALTT